MSISVRRRRASLSNWLLRLDPAEVRSGYRSATQSHTVPLSAKTEETHSTVVLDSSARQKCKTSITRHRGNPVQYNGACVAV